jgi:hypothetical protein
MRRLEAVATITLVAAVIVVYLTLSHTLLAWNTVASLLSPNGLTTDRVALALSWVVLRLVVVFGVPALLAFGLTRYLTASAPAASAPPPPAP